MQKSGAGDSTYTERSSSFFLSLSLSHSLSSKRLCARAIFFPLSSQSRNPSITIKFSSLRVAFFSLCVFFLLLFFVRSFVRSLACSLCAFFAISFSVFFFLLRTCLVCCVPKPLLNAGRNFQTSILIISDRPTYLSHLGRIPCEANL